MFLVDLSAAADHFLVKIDQLRCQLLAARRHGDRLVDTVICADDPAVFVSSHKLFHQKKHPLHRFFIVIQMLSIVHAVITRNSGLACRCRMEIYDSINLIRLTPVENIIQHGKGIFIIRSLLVLCFFFYYKNSGFLCQEIDFYYFQGKNIIFFKKLLDKPKNETIMQSVQKKKGIRKKQ